ncbi:MAG: immunoglobulin domain-containing protein [Opitutus sp.]
MNIKDRSGSFIANSSCMGRAWMLWLIVSTATFAQTAPVITSISSPRQVVPIGQILTLQVEATGIPAPTYQWKRNGRVVPGAVFSTYTIAGASRPHDDGWYQVVVANSSGTATSAVIFVNVAVSPALILTAGNYDAPQSPVPTNLTDVVSVAAGAGHWLALKTDGTVAAWGANSYGQSSVPSDLNNVVAVAASNYCSYALKVDGSVRAWGDGSFQQTRVPEGLNNAVAIVAGSEHALALKADGTVVGWGWNEQRQAIPPPDLRDVVGISAGQSNSFAWRADGTAVGWGDNSLGRTTVPSYVGNVVGIGSGEDFSIALKADGNVIVWGPAYFSGLKGLPDGFTNVVSIAVGSDHVMALRADGTVVAAGQTYTGPAMVPAGASNVVAISVQDSYTILLCRKGRIITLQPQSQTVSPGSTVAFAVTVNGATLPTFQWLKDGDLLPGATNATLVVPQANGANAGTYVCTVTDLLGSTQSEPAQLTVSLAANTGRIINLSTRALAGTGSQTLILGAVISGSTAGAGKPLLFRAVGPSLAALNVPGFLADPTFELNSGGRKIDENDNWSGDAEIATISSRVGAFPLGGASSKDAARYRAAVAPGAYSMLVTGVGGTTGVALAEIYDAQPSSTLDLNSPRLVNASARAHVRTGSDLLIVGFVIGGETSRTLLIRAVGPSLETRGVSFVLPDPQLQLYSGSTRLRENDNWSADMAANAAAFVRVGAFPLPSDSKDAALLITLPPGAYTAQVSDVNGSTGVALVELYEVP